MLAMVIRVMIGCVSTNHKSDCEIWPNSFLAAPVSRGEKCLMRSFSPVPSPLLSSSFFPFSLLSQSVEESSYRKFRVIRSIEGGGGNLEIQQVGEGDRDASLTGRGDDDSVDDEETASGRKWRDTLGGKVTSG